MDLEGRKGGAALREICWWKVQSMPFTGTSRYTSTRRRHGSEHCHPSQFRRQHLITFLQEKVSLRENLQVICVSSGALCIHDSLLWMKKAQLGGGKLVGCLSSCIRRLLWRMALHLLHAVNLARDYHLKMTVVPAVQRAKSPNTMDRVLTRLEATHHQHHPMERYNEPHWDAPNPLMQESNCF